MVYRDFSIAEKFVISFLLHAAKKDDDYIPKFFSVTRCSALDDGGMGSIRFFSNSNMDDDGRVLGGEISSCHFTDVDGVMVSVALYIDSFGSPFELDVWKVDFSPLRRMPTDRGELVLDSSV